MRSAGDLDGGKGECGERRVESGDILVLDFLLEPQAAGGLDVKSLIWSTADCYKMKWQNKNLQFFKSFSLIVLRDLIIDYKQLQTHF